jgi:hypothetical protein
MELPIVTSISQLSHTDAEVMYLHDPLSGVLRVADASKDMGGSAYLDFSGTIGTGIGDMYRFENSCGHSSVGFHLTIPSGGEVQFQGSYDGVNFTPIQMRELSSNGYVQITDHTEDYLGSISAVRSMRFILTAAGNLPATVAGRACKDSATLEGIENANPPHRFGNELFHKGFSLSNGVTGNMSLFTPPSGNKFVLTYISFSAISTAGANITFHETPDTGVNANNWVFSTFVKTNANETQFFNIILSTPFVASGANNTLFFSTDASVTTRGVIHGYNTTI